MNHVMLDLETLGTGPDAAVVAIGAVAFDPHRPELGGAFYRTIHLTAALDNGGTVDGPTLTWWLGQPDAARRELTRADAVDSVAAARDFFAFCESLGDTADLRVWGNGAACDNVILRRLYARLGSRPPWDYWHDRCYRTVKAFYPHIKRPAPAIPHHALEDARAQAQHLLAMLASTPAITLQDGA